MHGFTVKVLNPACGKRAVKMSPCSFCKTAVRQTRFPKAARPAGLCVCTVNSQTFIQGGAARCMGGYCELSLNYAVDSGFAGCVGGGRLFIMMRDHYNGRDCSDSVLCVAVCTAKFAGSSYLLFLTADRQWRGRWPVLSEFR